MSTSEFKGTAGKFSVEFFSGSPEIQERALKAGLALIPNLSNEGQRYIMVGEGDDRKRVALVDCQTDFKRGKGHQQECAERDANSKLFAASKDLLEALQLFAHPSLGVTKGNGETLIGWHGSDMTADQRLYIARVAIDKALK